MADPTNCQAESSRQPAAWTRRVSLVLGAAAGAPVLVAASKGGAVVPQCLLAAGLVCSAGLALSIWCVVRARRHGFGARFHKLASTGFGAGLLTTTILGFVVCLLFIREMGMAMWSGENLKAVANGLYKYTAEYGHYPATLEEIMRANGTNFLFPADHQAAERPLEDWERLICSSYVYVPGEGQPVGDQDVIVAYQREPFPRVAILALPQRRCVAYGDSYVACLTENGFRVAMAKDQKRRRELGWSTTQPKMNE